MAGAALAAMVLLLLIEIVVRPWSGYGLPGSQVFVRQLTMWVALLGAALAARDGRLLGLATAACLTSADSGSVTSPRRRCQQRSRPFYASAP